MYGIMMNEHNATQDNEMEMDTAVGGAEEESFKKLFEASLKEQPILKKGETVKGVVVSVDQEVVTLDVGAKNEGTVPVSEFTRAGQELPKVGDEVEALVVSIGSSGANLSVLEGRRRELWAEVEAAQESGALLQATVVKEVKGGFRVDLGGLGAFMPRSEADTDARIAADLLIGKTVEVALLEATRKPENIVVSRKQPLMKVQEEQRAVFFAKHAIGDKVSGEVKRLTDFGAFVDIGGLDALLHVSDISWRRIERPEELLSAGQKVSAEIIKLNPETGKVSISMKNLQDDPWSSVASKYEPGMRLTGTVRRLLDFGAVVELEAGIEGMIHRSEMSWLRKDVKPTEVLSEGDVVDVAVLSVEPEERRIRLSLKEVSENPWQSWLADHPVGSKLTGKVKNVTDFGFFVGLDGDLDGLVHIGNISWEQEGAEAIKGFSKGQEVETVVLGVDVDRQRISLGIKQLSDDPFELFLAGVKRGGTVSGKVVEVHSGAVIVELADGITARLPLREVPREHAELKEGSEVEAKITDVNRKRRQVELSVRQLLRDEGREAVRSYTQNMQEENEPSALALELQKLLGKKG